MLVLNVYAYIRNNAVITLLLVISKRCIYIIEQAICGINAFKRCDAPHLGDLLL